MRLGKLLTPVLLLFSFPFLFGENSLQVEIVESGIYERDDPVGISGETNTTPGYVKIINPVKNPKLIKATDQIPAAAGVRFGIRFTVRDKLGRSVIPLVVRVLHPPMRNPESGIESAIEEWKMEANTGIPRFTGWSFDTDWEMVPGDWYFQILGENKLLAQKKFTLIR